MKNQYYEEECVLALELNKDGAQKAYIPAFKFDPEILFQFRLFGVSDWNKVKVELSSGWRIIANIDGSTIIAAFTAMTPLVKAFIDTCGPRRPFRVVNI